jgi:hypothetical protein
MNNFYAVRVPVVQIEPFLTFQVTMRLGWRVYRKIFLNDHPTSQAKGLILRVSHRVITDTLCGHSSSKAQNQ